MADTPNSFCLPLRVVNWEATEGHWTVLSGTIPNLFQHKITSVFKYCVAGLYRINHCINKALVFKELLIP